MFKLKENQEQRHRKCSFNFSGAQFACVFDLVKFKHRDCVSQLTEFTETLKLVKLKRIIHLEMKILSLPTLVIFSCGTRNEMFCIMCEAAHIIQNYTVYIFSNDIVISSGLPALDGKVQHSVINNDRHFTFG